MRICQCGSALTQYAMTRSRESWNCHNCGRYQIFDIKRTQMARPASVKSRFFMRPMAQADNLIMAAAGEGDISQGFHNLIAMYQVLHNKGYRPTMDLTEWLTHHKGEQNKPNQDDSDAN